MPTFGDITQGGSSFPCSGNRAIFGLFTLSEAGDVQSIGIFMDAATTGGINIKGLIYAADGSGGNPGTRLAVGQAVAVPAGSSELTSTLSSPVSLAAGDYWIGAVASDFQARWSADDASAGGVRKEGVTYASPADPLGAIDGTTVDRISVYATYTTGGVGPLLKGKLVNAGRLRGFLKRA